MHSFRLSHKSRLGNEGIAGLMENIGESDEVDGGGTGMKNSGMTKLAGAIIGLIIGILVGAFLGLVIGGTFLGGFDIYENTGMEGYELAAYVGAGTGLVAGAILGVKMAAKRAGRK